TGNADKDIHRACNGKGNALGPLQGKGLGDKLAEQDLKVRNEREGDDDSEGVSIEDDMRGQDMEPVMGELQNHLRYRGFADPAERKSCKGHSELNGWKELVYVVLKLKHGTRARTAEDDELLDTRLTHADKSEFSGDEEAVGQDEEGHHDRS